MIVGGGMVPETNFTRQEVQRPRPPQVAVMSTPAAWPARRTVVPGSTWSVMRSGRMVRAMLMRAQGYHFRVLAPGAPEVRRATEDRRPGGSDDAIGRHHFPLDSPPSLADIVTAPYRMDL